MAEIPAFQERQTIDSDGDGQVSDAESAAYLAQQIPVLIAGLRLSAGGTALNLRPVAQSLSFPAGQGGLVTMRLTLDMEAPIALGQSQLAFAYSRSELHRPAGLARDRRAASAMAWRWTARPCQRPTRATSCTRYPEDMLSSPLDLREARFSAMAGPASGGAMAPVAATATRIAARTRSPR